MQDMCGCVMLKMSYIAQKSKDIAAERKEVKVQTEKKRRRGQQRLLLTPLPPVSSQELNLSYQDLGDPFQQENFLRILRRLIRVEKLQLIDNSLTSLSSVRLPRYEMTPKVQHNALIWNSSLEEL